MKPPVTLSPPPLVGLPVLADIADIAAPPSAKGNHKGVTSADAEEHPDV